MCKEVFTTIFAAMMLLVPVILICISGVGYGYFKNFIFFDAFDIKLKILYGCGIGIGLILLIVTFTIFAKPILWVHYLFSFPAFIIILSLYMYYSEVGQSSRYEVSIDNDWVQNSTTLINLQFEVKCCGWNNSADRGIRKCPFEFESGCVHLFLDYLQPRNHEVYVTTIVMHVFFYTSAIFLHIMICVVRETNLYKYIFPFCLF